MLKPLFSRRLPMDADATPFPSPEQTPPVTKMYLLMGTGLYKEKAAASTDARSTRWPRHGGLPRDTVGGVIYWGQERCHGPAGGASEPFPPDYGGRRGDHHG